MAEPKAGKTTSEYWVTAIAGVLAALNGIVKTSTDHGIDDQTIQAIAALVVAYTVGRSAVKITNKTPDTPSSG